MTAPAGTEVWPLALRPDLGVVATEDLSNGCSSVYLTNDFARWRNATPPASLPSNGSCLYAWQGAAFVSATDGWVLGRDGGSTDTVLYHTVDGGVSWVEQPGGATGSNGGGEVIGFANQNDGWRQQFSTGSNIPYSLEMTQDAGSSWRQVPSPQSSGGCQQALDVFSNAADGFAGNWLPPNGAVGPVPWLWQTTDGGTSWHELTVSTPPSLSGSTPVYGLPTFFGGANGVLPVVFMKAATASVAFYETTDFGITWSLQAVEPTTAAPPQAPACAPPSGVVGTFPAIAIAGPTTWWALTDGQSPSLAITTDAGQTWTTVNSAGLPGFEDSVVGAILQPPILEAASATVAWIFVSTVNETRTLFQTVDGGRTWTVPRLP